MTAEPTPHFAHPPYRAELFNAESGWSGVMNKNGVNCLRFVIDGKPTGQVITTFEQAKRIAEEWNGR